MRKLWLAVIGAVAAGSAVVVLTAPASASPPIAASGTFTITSFNQTFVKQSDGNVFFAEHDLADYTGTFTGSHVFDGTVEAFKDGSASFHGVATFTGTVAGCGSGTVVFEVNGAADPTGLVTKGHFGTLANRGTLSVHASLEVSGFLGTTMTYSGSYHC